MMNPRLRGTANRITLYAIKVVTQAYVFVDIRVVTHIEECGQHHSQGRKNVESEHHGLEAHEPLPPFLVRKRRGNPSETAVVAEAEEDPWDASDDGPSEKAPPAKSTTRHLGEIGVLATPFKPILQ